MKCIPRRDLVGEAPGARPKVVQMDDVGRASSDLVGGKASMLMQLSASGYAVPRFFVVSTAAFAEKMAPFVERHRLLPAGGERDGEVYRAACEHVDGVRHPDGFLREFRTQIAGIGDSQCSLFAVRSSSTLESSSWHSFSGMFATHLRCRGWRQALDGLRQVWCSCFDVAVLRMMRQFDLELPDCSMATIVQEFVDPAFSGIMTNEDPVTGERGDFIIEFCSDAAFSEVTGIERAQLFRVDGRTGRVLAQNSLPPRDGPVMVSNRTYAPKRVVGRTDLDGLTVRALPSLIDLASRLEGDYGFGWVAEWVWSSNEELFLLQLRSLPKSHTSNMISEDSRSKKGRICGTMATLGFSVCGLWRVDLEEGGLEDQSGRLGAAARNAIESKHVFVGFRDYTTYAILQTDVLAGSLASVLEILGVAGSRTGWLIVEEVIEPEFGGVSSLTREGGVRLEVVGGHIHGLTKGFLEPSVYIVDSHGTIVSREVHTQDEEFRLVGLPDGQRLGFRPKSVPERRVILDANLVGRIAELTVLANRRFPMSQVCWGILGTSVYFFDLLNDSSCSIEWSSDAVVSPGTARGTAFLIDCGRLEAVALDKRRYADSGLGCPPMSVIVAERPLLPLATLLHECVAFVFRKAPLFCHLVTLLRESGIPAVVCRDGFDRIGNGDLVEIRGDGSLDVSPRQQSRDTPGMAT